MVVTLLFAAEEFFNYNKEHRNEEDTEEGGDGHAANYGVTHGHTSTGTRAGGDCQGQAA